MLFSVKDRESKTFIPPFTMSTERDAIEGFRVVCNDEKTNYNKFPEDFYLVKLGNFDERSGKFDLLDEPEKISEAADLIKKNIN